MDNNHKKAYTRLTTTEDLPYLAKNLREEDKAEIRASSGIADVEAVLGLGLLGSRICKTICLPCGTPCGIYGVSDTPVAGLGAIWLLATPDLLKVQRQFIRESGRELREISKGYRCVYNYADARNIVHHRWLKRCGFTFIKKHENHGHEKRPFLEFVMITGV